MARLTLDRLRTYARLGPRNLARVGAYRLGLKSGRHLVLALSADMPEGPFFHRLGAAPENGCATTLWQSEAPYFSCHPIAVQKVPDWHVNPFRPGARSPENLPWFRIPDFNPAVGDIKCVWEASRMGWAVAMAQRAVLGDDRELERLNQWLADWLASNPPYQGANWKCGQEASIRVMHLILAAILLGARPGQSTAGLDAVIALHLTRIAPTISYAIGQANNHGTSEAAALFLGGVWLSGRTYPQADIWQAQGRRWLEDRARILIAPDGTFSQYSTVYHRVMLDTYCFVEAFRRRFDQPTFSEQLTQRLAKATDWLDAMMFAPDTGEVPNFGSNDGALLIPLSESSYRDFRPTLQTASLLFRNSRAVGDTGAWDQPALWLGINTAHSTAPAPQSVSFPTGGFHVLRCGKAGAMMHYPRFAFRPGHSDLLHVDFWVDGTNVLRDAGTYSYAADEAAFAYFRGVQSHNTIEFDNRDQMTNLDRFLFGAWPKAKQVTKVTDTGQEIHAAAGFTDDRGIWHHRALRLSQKSLIVHDRFSGHSSQAVLRWHLAPGQYIVRPDGASGSGIKLTVSTDAPNPQVGLTEAPESLYYLQKHTVPLLEIDVSDASHVTTFVEF